MENKNLTAVDWLYDQIENNGKCIYEVFEQSKQMEKEQIIDAFGVGCQVESTKLIGYHDKAEQYYKETFLNHNKR